MTLATSAYVEVANTLRELSILDTSGNRDGFTNERRDDILRQLRGQYETGRKLFTFAIANASKDVQSIITHFIPKYLLGHGMTAAAKVVEVGNSSMNAEEKKRFDALAPRKRPYGNQNYSYNAAISPRNDSLKDELVKLLQPAGKGNPASRSTCYNCQKVGHWAKTCPEPKKAEPTG